MTAIPLSRATLRDMPIGVTVPSYDPATITPGIVHLGLGNFPRAHDAFVAWVARYLKMLYDRGASATLAVSVTPAVQR